MKREEGVTLIELIISLGILTIVIVVVASSIITGLRVTDETSQRISESREAQIASAYFTNDVQTSVTVTVTNHAPYNPCNGGGTLNPLVSLEGANHDAFNQVTGTVSTYLIENNPSDDPRALIRHRCIKRPGQTSWQEDSKIPVISSLSDAPNDNVTCFASDGSPIASCSSVTQKVIIALEVCGRNQGGICVFNPGRRFTFSLVGTRRPT